MNVIRLFRHATSMPYFKKTALVFMISLFSIYISAESDLLPKDTLRFYGSMDFPPYEYVDEGGNAKGFGIDLIKAIMQEVGIPYTITLMDWDEVVKDYKSGKINMITGLSFSDARSKIYKFGISYTTINQAVVYRRGTGPYHKLSMLKGKKVMVDGSDLLEELMKDAGLHQEIVKIHDLRDGMRLLAAGRADVLLCAREVANYIIEDQGISNLEMNDLELLPKEYGYAGRDTRVLAVMDQALMKIKNNGTYEKIYDKWFYRYDSASIKRIVIISILVFLFVVSISFLFIVLLRRKVNVARAVISSQQQRLALALKSGDVKVWGYDVDRRHFYNIESDYFPPEGKTLAQVIETIHIDDRQLFLILMDDLSRGGKPIKNTCFRVRQAKDEAWHYISLEFAQVWDKESVVTVIGSHRDITDIHRMQSQLSESIRKMEYAIKSSNLVLWELETDTFECKCYNETLNGYDGKAVTPLPFFGGLIHPDDVKSIPSIVEPLKQGENKLVDFNLRIWYDSDHSWHYCTITASPFEVDKTGHVTRYVGLRRDDTQVIKLNDDLRNFSMKLNYVLKLSGIRIWECDVTAHNLTIYSEVNHALKKITCEDLFTFVHHSDLADLQQMIERMSQGNIDSFSKQLHLIRTLDGKEYDHYSIFNGQALKDASGHTISYFGLQRDVTNFIDIQHRLEEEKEKAQMADRLKSAFLANMSHEIRTPLNSIAGFSSLLQEEENPELKEKYVRIVNENTEVLLKLINDILDLSRIESGILDINVEEFDLSKSFDEICFTLAKRCTSEQVRFMTDNPYHHCLVRCDHNRLIQIITNFTINAFKYTPSGYIKVGYRYENGGLRVYVEDTGIGIPASKRERIFDRFEKLNEFAQGTGLGLSICKAITDACHGQIGVDSVEGHGSTFWAWIPCEMLSDPS